MTATANMRTVGERIESLLEELRASSDRHAQERVEEVVRLLMEFYGAGLERALEIVYADGRGDETMERLGDDELVSSLLVLHGLHPLDVEVRVQRALDHVRPYLGSHGGGVTIDGIDGDVVRIRMVGSCDGCPSSTVTITYAIERAILKAAPEISRVEAIETAGNGSDHAVPAGQLIQLTPRRAAEPAPNGGRSGDAAVEWVTPDRTGRLAAGEVISQRLSGTTVLLCGTGDQTYAYRDRCPSCSASLAAGRLVGDELSCPGCGHRFDVRHAGRSREAVSIHLEPLPLLSEGGAFRVAVPVVA